MTPHQKLTKTIFDQFMKIEQRLSVMEMKVSMLALNAGLVDYCNCYPEPNAYVILEGMPCCAVCEKIIKRFIEKPR